MKVLKVVIVILIVLTAIFFIGGMLLPKAYTVTRAILIQAPTAKVFMNVADFNNFLKWNPWSKMDPAADISITGKPASSGHLWKWKGKESGEGQMEIQRIEPNAEIVYLLTFSSPYESTAKNTFEFQPEGTATKVTWTMSGTGNSITERWMFLNIDNMIGRDFESGLKNLKDLSEKN